MTCTSLQHLTQNCVFFHVDSTGLPRTLARVMLGNWMLSLMDQLLYGHSILQHSGVKWVSQPSLYTDFPGHSCTSDFAISSAFFGGCSLCIIIFFCSLFSLDMYYSFILIAWVLIFSRASHCLCVLRVSELSLICVFFPSARWKRCRNTLPSQADILDVALFCLL